MEVRFHQGQGRADVLVDRPAATADHGAGADDGLDATLAEWRRLPEGGELVRTWREQRPGSRGGRMIRR